LRKYVLPTATGIDALALAECDVPKPGRGQILVRMRAASLNFRDLAVASGKYIMSKLPPDLVPLSDGAGEIVELGADVTGLAPGDRVAGLFMQSWMGGRMEPNDGLTALGGAIDGVLTEYRLFDARGVVRIPAHLSFEQAATLPCAALTAWNALFGYQQLLPGETVLTLGTGGVSIFALQFAIAAGARVIATSSSDEKLARAQALGASDGINYKDTPEWQARVRELTGGRGVDHVVEVGGPGTLQRSVQSARHGGMVTLIGVLTRGTLDPLVVFGAGAIVRPIYVGSRQMFEAMNAAITQHQITPTIDRVFPFEDAPAAYRHLKGATHVGKVVISI